MTSTSECPSLTSLFGHKVAWRPTANECCQRCNATVYHAEKIGPVNNVVFHRQCFLCTVCRQHLTLRTYFTNQADLTDKEIYCSTHCPRSSSHSYDSSALLMQSAALMARRRACGDQTRGSGNAPRIQFDAMHISEPVSAQTRYQRKFTPKLDQYQYPAFVVSKTKAKVLKLQENLEQAQRVTEDELIATFHAKRKQQQASIQQETDAQWEQELKRLTEKYTKNSEQKAKSRDKLTGAAREKYEQEKDELRKTVTMRMAKKRKELTLRLEREQQDETTELVKKHSQQMLGLLHSRELKQELQRAIDAELGEEGGVDSAHLVEEALAALMPPTELPPAHPPRGRKRDFYHDPAVFQQLDSQVMKIAESEQSSFTELVKQLTANCVTDLDKARAIFRWITLKDLNVMQFDETVADQDTPLGLLRGIKYGTETYHVLFLRLCSYAGLPCAVIKGHSKSVGYQPGMKITEDAFQNTWNAVLIDGDWWPVQCNWGARHLVLNKDSNIYKLTNSEVTTQPGLGDESAGASNVSRKSRDKIKYQYDEHYFLTDPDEFIQEFLASDPEWQLLEFPITLKQFEDMPFVRSIFFHYGLEFDGAIGAVITADESGTVEVRIKVPPEHGHDLVFHYQLRFAEIDRHAESEYNGYKLERYVFHTVFPAGAMFSVHVPATGEYYLEIFTNRIDDRNKLSDDPNSTILPFRLKCSCKFKIVCRQLSGPRMHPLPDCASGEWGPWKARRHVGLEPMSHLSGVINAEEPTIEIRFKVPRPLYFQCKLRCNGLDSKQLDQMVQNWLDNGILAIRVTLPNTFAGTERQAGNQYGLDIYVRPLDTPASVAFAHACKYLINHVGISRDSKSPIAYVKVSDAYHNVAAELNQRLNPVDSPRESNQRADRVESPRDSNQRLNYVESPRYPNQVSDSPRQPATEANHISTNTQEPERITLGATQEFSKFKLGLIAPVDNLIVRKDLEPVRVEIERQEPTVKLTASLVYEATSTAERPMQPGAKISDQVIQKDDRKRTKFTVKPPHWGTFILRIYAEGRGGRGVDSSAEKLMVYTCLLAFQSPTSSSGVGVINGGQMGKKRGIFK